MAAIIRLPIPVHAPTNAIVIHVGLKNDHVSVAAHD